MYNSNTLPNDLANTEIHTGENVSDSVQVRLLRLVNLPENEYSAGVETFVASRIEEFSNIPPLNSISLLHKDPVKDFIQPETAMIAHVLQSIPYHLDDARAYDSTFNWIRQLYFRDSETNPVQDPERTLTKASVEATQIGLVQYFGSYAGDAAKRALAVADIIDEDRPQSESISCFGSSAVCLERAAIAHNTLKILGIDSTLVLGRLREHDKDGSIITSEAHAWILLRLSSGKQVQFDPTNPILYRNEMGEVTWAKPNLKLLPDDKSSGIDVELLEINTNSDRTQSQTVGHLLHYDYETEQM